MVCDARLPNVLGKGKRETKKKMKQNQKQKIPRKIAPQQRKHITFGVLLGWERLDNPGANLVRTGLEFGFWILANGFWDLTTRLFRPSMGSWRTWKAYTNSISYFFYIMRTHGCYFQSSMQCAT